MSEHILTNTVYIRTTPDALWHALTDGDESVQYVGARVQSTWRPSDEIVYLSPDGSVRLIEGILVQVEPLRRFAFDGRVLLSAEFAADAPHRETFEMEDIGGGLCRCTAIFDGYAPDSPTYRFQNQGNMQMCGSSLKSLLETGRALEFPTLAKAEA